VLLVGNNGACAYLHLPPEPARTIVLRFLQARLPVLSADQQRLYTGPVLLRATESIGFLTLAYLNALLAGSQFPAMAGMFPGQSLPLLALGALCLPTPVIAYRYARARFPERRVVGQGVASAAALFVMSMAALFAVAFMARRWVIVSG
jgi:hypothetical protein